MLIIDNREEIKHYLLKETGSPEATELFLNFLDNQEILSQIYEKHNKYDVFNDSQPHSFEEIKKKRKISLLSKGLIGISNIFAIGGYTIIELFNQAASIITVGGFSYKLYQENKKTINNFIQTNASKEEIEAKLKKMLTKAIMKVKIKETSKEDENATDTVMKE